MSDAERFVDNVPSNRVWLGYRLLLHGKDGGELNSCLPIEETVKFNIGLNFTDFQIGVTDAA